MGSDPGNGYYPVQDGTQNEQRIFPDRQWRNGVPEDDQAAQFRCRVLVRVKIGTMAKPQKGQEVFLRFFDVNDPSSPTERTPPPKTLMQIMTPMEPLIAMNLTGLVLGHPIIGLIQPNSSWMLKNLGDPKPS